MTQSVANTIYRFFAAVDDRDWNSAQGLMRNPFHLDYSSFGAGDPADLDPTAILEGWAQFLPGFDATHHQLGNLAIEVDDDSAVVDFYGTATHVIEDRSWVVVGTYRATLIGEGGGWLLTGLQFLFKFQLGDTDLPAEAQARLSDSR